MKKLFITIILLGIVLAPVGAGVVFAQDAPGNAPATNGEVNSSCGVFSLLDCFTFIIAETGNAVLTLVSKVLDIAGAVLNFSVETTVNMGDFLSKVKIVDVGWKVFRDIANLFFIFVLLWIGIRTILGLGGGEIKKLLLNVILMALLINFSLFITKAVVDAGNVATIHFYNAMRPDLYENIKQPNGTYVRQPARDAQGKQLKAGLSDIYMEALKMQTFMGEGSSANDAVASAGGFTNQFIKIFVATTLGSVFFLVTAFIFFAAAFLFIIRAVVLMLVMLLSPLAFVAQILPASQAQKLASDWWHALFSQTFFAPLYMALTYAVAKAIQSGGFGSALNITGNQASFAAVLASDASDNIGIVVNYIILIIVMAATLLIASKLGAYGSGMVMGWGKGLQKWGQGVAGRHTLGRLGEMGNRIMSGGVFDRSPVLRGIRNTTFGALYGSKFGSGQSRRDIATTRQTTQQTQRQAQSAQAINQNLQNQLNSGTLLNPTVISGMNNPQISAINPALLANKQVADSLTVPQLTHLATVLTAPERAAVRAAVLTPPLLIASPAYTFMTTGPGVLW